MDLDFTNLPIASVFAMAAALAALDVGTAVVLSLIHKNFSPAYVTDYLRTHVLKVIFPILALSAFGHGIAIEGAPPLIPAIPAAGIAASASLALYAVKTIKSVIDNFGDTSPTPE